MPEKPEVLTVVKALKRRIIGKTITDCSVYWDNIIVFPHVSLFKSKIKNQTVRDIRSRGKWILIELTNDTLLVHLRMEGKFFFREKNIPKDKHEHVIFTLDGKEEMRFADVRKFGKMYLLSNDEVEKREPLISLGYEFDDPKLTKEYLFAKFSKKNLPIKTVLLDQSIITGIGNIYDDEILYMCHLNPLTKASDIKIEDCEKIIKNTKIVLEKAIALGGTTIRSYTSEEGVHGKFQHELLVHGKDKELCPNCHNAIVKIKVNGRGTYYCPVCQKK